MDQLTLQLRCRVVEARRALVEARLAGDDYLVDIQLAVLDELARVARANDIDLAVLEATDPTTASPAA